ncbi:MAG: hypothetical protein FJ316_09990 [SAR202 cluster bacterium]|nr:hypothetical protein [SAR202 cluster bacterium]
MITKAFIVAAQNRARALGLTEHPVVVIDHPIASKNRSQILTLAQDSVSEVAQGLITALGRGKSG